MSMTDPIADLLCRIHNAHTAKHDRMEFPTSNVKLEICRILTEQGYIEGFERVEDDEPVKKSARVFLKYNHEGQPAIRKLKRISKPGRRVYCSTEDLKPVLNGLGIGIISTSVGLLTDQEAREKRVGGEVLCEVW
ncbi:MAG: 30S ribosomal protein S8 [Acidobacteriota bacterium]|nr:30S ribosomal protein S8 [Acidobacteriota bacterium]